MSHKFEVMIPELNNARIRRTPDGKCSVYDLIEVVGGQKNPKQVWKRISEKYSEVVTECDYFKFPGRGQRETPVVDAKGWAYVLGLLPGVMGKQYREKAADIVTRYVQGDVKLAAEIVERNDNEADLEWLESRVRSKINRKRLVGIYKAHGVRNLGRGGNGYAICTNMLYSGLYGTNAKGLRRRKGLSSKANLRDSFTVSELNTVAFSEDLSGKKVKVVNAKGNDECAAVTYDVAKRVANFARDVLSA